MAKVKVIFSSSVLVLLRMFWQEKKEALNSYGKTVCWWIVLKVSENGGIHEVQNFVEKKTIWI